MVAGEWMTAKDWAEDVRRRILDAKAENRLVMMRPEHAEMLAKILDQSVLIRYETTNG